METSREIDSNGFVRVERNPITRAGVFPYSGRSIPGADATKIFNVWRPAEELADPETIKSFRGLPIFDEHPSTLIGPNMPAEQKGTHGASGDDVIFDGSILFAPLSIFSETLKRLIDLGKKQISAGYKCRYEKSSGFFEGVPYDYIQRVIRGNHFALVKEGRSGSDIAVLDSMALDHFDLALDETNKESTVADDDKSKEKDGAKDEGGEGAANTEKAEMTMAEVAACLKEILPAFKAMQETVAAMGAAGAAGTMDKDEKEKDGDSKEGDAKDEDDKEKGKAMDSAVIELRTRLDKVEKRGMKEVLSALTERDAIVREITPLVGTFDHADKTTDEVVAYACDKLDLKVEPALQHATLKGYLAGKKTAAKTSELGFALDTAVKEGSLLDKTLKGAKA